MKPFTFSSAKTPAAVSRHFGPLLALGLAILAAPFARAEPALPATLPSSAGRLGFFADKVRQREPVKVVYFRGVQDPEAGTAWLQESPFGRALLAKNPQASFACLAPETKPSAESADLYLIDAVIENDTDTQAIAELERQLRLIWQANPRAAVVFIYSTTEDWMAEYRGKLPPAVNAQHAIAARYGVAEIDIAARLANAAISGQWRVDEVLGEGFLLASRGQDFYGRVLGDTLTPALDWKAEGEPPALPAVAP